MFFLGVINQMAIGFMLMSIRNLRVEACIIPLLVLLMLHVITTIDLAIEVMIAGERTCSPMATRKSIMLSTRVAIGDMSSIDRLGTRGKLFLHNQGIQGNQYLAKMA